MSEEIKDIFECLKKYANLTPDAIDDLYYLEGTIEDLQQKVEQLENIRKEAIEYIGTNIPARALEQLYTNYELGESLLFVKTAEDLLKILNKGGNNE